MKIVIETNKFSLPFPTSFYNTSYNTFFTTSLMVMKNTKSGHWRDQNGSQRFWMSSEYDENIQIMVYKQDHFYHYFLYQRFHNQSYSHNSWRVVGDVSMTVLSPNWLRWWFQISFSDSLFHKPDLENVEFIHFRFDFNFLSSHNFWNLRKYLNTFSVEHFSSKKWKVQTARTNRGQEVSIFIDHTFVVE